MTRTMGSPPQVWGKRAWDSQRNIDVRFTPTGVGKTGWMISWTLQPAVHPHRCGENRSPASDTAQNYGSPPQVWGKRWPMEEWRAEDRFTPTGVGKTTDDR